MGTGHLREGDADLLLAVLEAARHDDPGPAVPWSLLDGLLRLVPCDLGVSYQCHDYRHRRRLFLQAAEEDGSGGVEGAQPSEEEDRFFQLWWSSICSWPQRTGDLRSVIHTGDLYPTERALRADPMHAEVLTGVTGELIVSLPAPPGESRRFLFMRSCGTPFSERDRQVLELLRPHLYEVWLDAERRRAGVPPLSPREWEVLALPPGQPSTVMGTRWTRLLAMPWRFHSCLTGWAPSSSLARRSSSHVPGVAVQS
jgi:hypothetical protein